jgi:hypothetical protein
MRGSRRGRGGKRVVGRGWLSGVGAREMRGERVMCERLAGSSKSDSSNSSSMASVSMLVGRRGRERGRRAGWAVPGVRGRSSSHSSTAAVPAVTAVGVYPSRVTVPRPALMDTRRAAGRMVSIVCCESTGAPPLPPSSDRSTSPPTNPLMVAVLLPVEPQLPCSSAIPVPCPDASSPHESSIACGSCRAREDKDIGVRSQLSLVVRLSREEAAVRPFEWDWVGSVSRRCCCCEPSFD